MNIVTRPLNPTELHYTLSEAERALRIELAAAFRVAHHYRWNLQISNHITARLPDHPDRFLMNPYGLGWDEITASNLVTIDFQGRVLSHEGVQLAPAGYNFHSGILKARPDLNCVIHVHATPGVVIAATKGGLISMLRALAVEFARHGVRANAILPGWIETDMTANAIANEKFAKNVLPRIPMRRWGTGSDFGGIAVYLMSSASAYHTGDTFLIDGGYALF